METGNVSETLNFDPQLTLLVARDVIISGRRKTGVHKFSKIPGATSKF
jgi:hypothetical protein